MSNAFPKPYDVGKDYDSLATNFRWHIPEFYNIGDDVSTKWARCDPERLALIYQDTLAEVYHFSFGNIDKLANQSAHLLSHYGIKPSDRVAILLGQRPETAYSHVAIYKMAAIAVPLFRLFGPDALRYRLADSGAKAIITDTLGLEKLREFSAELRELRVIFNVDASDQAPFHPQRLVDFHSERERHPESFNSLKTKAEDPAIIIYTS
ncbi:MAG: AMP-binding protein, partial [Deinococcales bacterium]